MRAQRIAVSAYFLAAGVGLGAWVACLPALSLRADLDKRQLGMVLLCFALGAIMAMTSTGRIVARHGTGLACVLCAIVFGAVLAIVPNIASSVIALSGLIFVGGAAFGALDVAMNVEASVLEQRSRRAIMSSFHALFSVGNLIGAAASAQVLRLGGGMTVCLVAGGATVAALAAAAWWWSPVAERTPEERSGQPHDRVRIAPERSRQLWLLGGVAFLALLSEGALMDWSAIYLVGTIGTSESAGALGFAVLAGAMAVGRVIGDAATRIAGPERLLRYGALAVALSLAIALALRDQTATYVALAVCGLGVANVVPILFSSAGRIGGDAVGPAMSRISTMGYAGLLVGPAFIGFVAEATSLTSSLCAIVVFALVVAGGARLVRAS
ncbi:MAG: MFS transporter [Rhizobiaceae bacterium]|nr:MFS transporter [Rhizobiaceae bacterium]